MATIIPSQHHAILTLDQVAEEVQASRRFIEKRVEDGELKVFRPSRRLVRIRRSELERWIEAHSTKGVVA